MGIGINLSHGENFKMIQITGEMEERITTMLQKIWVSIKNKYLSPQTVFLTIRRREVKEAVLENIELGKETDPEALTFFQKLRQSEKEIVLRQSFPEEWYGR